MHRMHIRCARGPLMAATTLGLSSGSRTHSPSPPARTDLRLRATRSWLKQRGALREDPNQRGDACAGLGTPRGLRRQPPWTRRKRPALRAGSLARARVHATRARTRFAPRALALCAHALCARALR